MANSVRPERPPTPAALVHILYVPRIVPLSTLQRMQSPTSACGMPKRNFVTVHVDLQLSTATLV